MKRGYRTINLGSELTGEAGALGCFWAQQALQLQRASRDQSIAIIGGGESIVKLGKTSGKGGRNQEIVMAFYKHYLSQKGDLDGVTFLSGGTDGEDGPTDAAGAYLCSKHSSLLAGLDASRYLKQHNSYEFCRLAGLHIKTGFTGTNVTDLHVLLL